MNIREESLKKHYEWQGKIEMVSRVNVETKEGIKQYSVDFNGSKELQKNT